MAGAYYPFSHKYADLPFIAWGWSLAYCIIYFILALVLIVRIARRPAQMAVYVWLLLLCAARVTTFVLRVVIPWYYSDRYSSSHLRFPHHLMGGSVAFLPLAIACLFEAVSTLLIRWHTVAGANVQYTWTRHVLIGLAAALGIAAAELQIYAPMSEGSMSESGAMGVGLASGLLFLALCVLLLINAAHATFTRTARGRRTTPLLVVGGCVALVLQSIGFLLWLIPSEDQMYAGTEFGTTPAGVFVLTALPDFVVLALFAITGLDDLENVTWFGRRKSGEGALTNGVASDEEVGLSASRVKASI